MAVNPAQKVILRSPIGINNYNGKYFRCFTRGDTLPFGLTFVHEDGEPVDVTDWRVYVSFSPILNCSDPGCVGSGLVVEVEIPIHDPEKAIFIGDVSDEYTLAIPCGLTYASIKYVDNNDKTHILDMCRLEVFPNVNPSVF